MKRAMIAFGVAFFALSVLAQQQDGFSLREAVGVKSYPAAPRLAEQAAMPPATVLSSAVSTVPEELLAMREWNASGGRPLRNGFRRTLQDIIDLRLSGAIAAKGERRNFARGIVSASQRGTIIWSTVVKVEKAHRLRLHLENVALPEGAVLWVYGMGETPTGFGRELMDNQGSLWTPSVRGELAYLEIEVPSAEATTSFVIREVLELVELNRLDSVQPQDEPTCLIDSTCVNSSTFASVSFARRATAHLEFVTDGKGAICTGGLLNDRNSTGTPFLLTANHCFPDQSAASTLESFFDYQTTSCNGSFNVADALRTVGATLLASSESSDFTFVRLNSIPSNRYLLGWNAAASAVPSGTTIHRISHPFAANTIFPQSYSSTMVNTVVGTCQSLPRPNFIYSTGGVGGVYGGSSGSPVMLANGQVVGQLLGSCGPDPEAGCDPRNSTVDGAFSSTYPFISQFLEGSGATPGGPCVPGTTTLCLQGGQYEVKTQATFNNVTHPGHQTKVSEQFGYFSVPGLTADPTNIEIFIKITGLVNGKNWIFFGGISGFTVDIDVRNTQTGRTKRFTIPGGSYQGGADFNTFP